jgi:hypothetical protein
MMRGHPVRGGEASAFFGSMAANAILNSLMRPPLQGLLTRRKVTGP